MLFGLLLSYYSTKGTYLLLLNRTVKGIIFPGRYPQVKVDQLALGLGKLHTAKGKTGWMDGG